MNYLVYTNMGTSPSGKTKKVMVSNKFGIELGQIEWYAPWRKYCFSSLIRLYDVNCLQEIMFKLNEMNQEHKDVKSIPE